MESLNSKKFESFKDSKISKLSAISGGAADKTEHDQKTDYSYGKSDANWTYTKQGDTETGFPPGTPTF